MTTVIRFKNWNPHQKGQHGILVQPSPSHLVAWEIDAMINALGKLTYTDLPHEDSYTIFWLKERATDEKMQAVIGKVAEEVTA